MTGRFGNGTGGFRASGDASLLSEAELRALARRHAAHLRKFTERRRRLRERAESPRVPAVSVPANEPRPQARAVPAVPAAPAPPRVPAAPVPAGALPQHPGGFLKKIGVEGLSFSLIFHAIFCVLAVFIVVSVREISPPDEPTFFATGSGGGRGGERPSYADVQASRRSAGLVVAGTRAPRIVSSARTAKIALPEAAAPSFSAPTAKLGSAFSRMSRRGLSGVGELSSGMGGGLGGGVGFGMGAGMGGGRNFVSRKILGTNVTAARLAVYMDNSGSMTQVIPVVREEILKKFPTADVYEFFGCEMGGITEPRLTSAQAKTWERERVGLLKKFSREKKPETARLNASKATRGNADDFAWESALSSYGRSLYSMWRGSDAYFPMDLGQWMHMALSDGGYDALIVFADFQDYADGDLPDEAGLLSRWLELARRNGQRLYLFTTEMTPQNIFLALAEATGGDVAIPRETAKKTPAAEQTRKNLLARKKGGNGAPPTLTSASSVPADDEEGAADAGVPAEESDLERELEELLRGG